MELEIELSEKDLPDEVRASCKATMAGGEVLGGSRAIARVIADVVPTALATHLQRVCPPGYSVGEIEIKLKLTGMLFGSGIEGEATVHYEPIPKAKV